MIRINQLKLSIRHTKEELYQAVAKTLKIPSDRIEEITFIKKSIDARKKEEIKYIYTVDVKLNNLQKLSQEDIIKYSKNSNVMRAESDKYDFTPSGSDKLKHRPVVIGTGPAGLFCAWLLAKYGFQPLVLERGAQIRQRVKDVECFWSTNELNPNSNVQFGEGGAGTFSDGKLNTMVKDAFHRSRLVLETFVAFGAPADILYLNKPHIGTDKLRGVVEGMRNEIIRLGGEVRFHSMLTNIRTDHGRLAEIEVNHKEVIPCEVLIPAIGHSARDTFEMLYHNGLQLTPKAFAIGLRIEHKQHMISTSQFGKDAGLLPPADYKLTHQTGSGRGVYSFCMCPGGFVVNASSEAGHQVVNGMSNYLREEENANSAIVVTVQPEDFGDITDPLCGIAFQRRWERAAFLAGKGAVPVQLFGDLLRNKDSVTIGKIKPSIKGSYQLSNLTQCLPSDVIAAMKEGILAFDHKIKGFADEEAVLSGVETRTSSPVRILRDESLESNITGIYPCGEGAGYAGGITSAAIDGIKVFEAIAKQYAIFRWK